MSSPVVDATSQKWSALMGLEGGSTESKSSTSLVFGIVVLAVAAGIVWAIMQKATTSSSNQESPNPVSRLVKAVAVPEVAPEPTSDEPVDAVVVARRDTTSRHFTTDEDVGPEPQMDGYSEFSNTFQSKRNLPEYDVAPASQSIMAQVGLLKAALKANGQTLEQYVAGLDTALPEGLLDAFRSSEISKEQRAAPVDDISNETRMLAREALQTVSTRGKPDVETLREILAARTEAAKLNVTMPSIPEDQKAALKFWASNDTHEAAAKIARTILARE